MDHICAAFINCGNQKCDLDVPTAHHAMCDECCRAKKPVLKGHTKVSQESNEKNVIKNVQAKKKMKKNIAFGHVNKKIKVSEENK